MIRIYRSRSPANIAGDAKSSVKNTEERRVTAANCDFVDIFLTKSGAGGNIFVAYVFCDYGMSLLTKRTSIGHTHGTYAHSTYA